MLVTSIFSFSHHVFYHVLENKSLFKLTCDLSSANDHKMDELKILSFS